MGFLFSLPLLYFVSFLHVQPTKLSNENGSLLHSAANTNTDAAQDSYRVPNIDAAEERRESQMMNADHHACPGDNQEILANLRHIRKNQAIGGPSDYLTSVTKEGTSHHEGVPAIRALALERALQRFLKVYEILSKFAKNHGRTTKEASKAHQDTAPGDDV